MGKYCGAGQYWDAVVKDCLDCSMVCQRPHVVSRCISHCVSADCKAQSGYYYDVLLKTCLSCDEVCGRHPPQCSTYCPRSVVVTTADSALLLYVLLSLCTVLLLSSLSLALTVFMRRVKSSKLSQTVPEDNDRKTEGLVHLGDHQSGTTVNSFVKTSSRPLQQDMSDDSSPTETCVCVHCFPDLKTPSAFHQQGVLQTSHAPRGQSVWTQDWSSSGNRVHVDTAVG